MPIRKTQSKGPVPPPTARERTGDYSLSFSPPQPYNAIQPKVPMITPSWAGSIPSISTRDLGYFFNLASSLYDENPVPVIGAAAGQASPSADAPPAYGQDFQNTALDPSAILVIWLFRQTRIDIHPIAERFHLGPADRQPLYSLTGQPSIRSATEFNELAIQRRDPIKGVWHSICTSDIEPSLDLVKPGSWRVAKLVMESMPVWKKVVSGSVVMEAPASAKGTGNSLCLSWGDRKTLGCLGDAYGLWWETGVEGGFAEAFYVIEGWKGFDSHPQGLIRVRKTFSLNIELRMLTNHHSRLSRL
jgi:hypothetical protein